MADPLDVLTINDATEALRGLQGAQDLSKLAARITSLSRRLDEACGPIVARAVTEVHTDEAGVLTLGGRPFTSGSPPPPPPVVAEALRGETPVVTSTTAYLLEAFGVTGRVTKWNGWWAPRVTVTYTAGRFASTDTVDDRFKSAAQLYLQDMWRRSEGVGTGGYGPAAPGGPPVGWSPVKLPNSVVQVLYGELLPPSFA